MRAQVLDARTGQPIPGAVVVGVWARLDESRPPFYGDVLGVQEVETDAAGRFVLEVPAALRIDLETVTVYKVGYVAWNNQYVFPDLQERREPGVPPQIRLEPFPPGQRHREHVRFIEGVRGAVLYPPERVPRLQEALRRERELP